MCALEDWARGAFSRGNDDRYGFYAAICGRIAGNSTAGGLIIYVRARISIYRGYIAACYRLCGIYAVNGGY